MFRVGRSIRFSFLVLAAGGAVLTAASSAQAKFQLGPDYDPALDPATDSPVDGGANRGSLPEVPESVYDTPPLRTPGEGFNDGAVHVAVNVSYLTDYVFRGIEPVEPTGGEDAINFLTDSSISFDLGRLPDPFVRIVTNTAEGDEISKFQVIRPSVGLHWETQAFELTFSNQSFTYPDRDDLDTIEVNLDVHLNDGLLFGEDGPLFGPFIFAAYDYDAFEGLYLEAGLRREVALTESNLTLGLEGYVAYVDGYGNFFANPASGETDVSGFQHYQIGAWAGYDLNTLLNISRRYGQWSVEGYINYTDGIDEDLWAESQIWGGAGIAFRY